MFGHVCKRTCHEVQGCLKRYLLKPSITVFNMLFNDVLEVSAALKKITKLQKAKSTVKLVFTVEQGQVS